MGKKGTHQISGFSGRTIGNMIKKSTGPQPKITRGPKKGKK